MQNLNTRSRNTEYLSKGKPTQKFDSFSQLKLSGNYFVLESKLINYRTLNKLWYEYINNSANVTVKLCSLILEILYFLLQLTLCLMLFFFVTIVQVSNTFYILFCLFILLVALIFICKIFYWLGHRISKDEFQSINALQI